MSTTIRAAFSGIDEAELAAKRLTEKNITILQRDFLADDMSGEANSYVPIAYGGLYTGFMSAPDFYVKNPQTLNWFGFTDYNMQNVIPDVFSRDVILEIAVHDNDAPSAVKILISMQARNVTQI